VLVALAPGVGAVLVALGPGPAGGESSLASDVSLHALHGGSAENDLVFQPFPGGHGGQYVFRTPAIPHPTAFNVAFGLAAAFIFIYGAVAYLRRRSAPAETVALNGVRSAVA